MRRIRVLVLIIGLMIAGQVTVPGSVAAATVKRQAIITEILRTGATARIKLDYVEIRSCDCDDDFEIVNNNPLIRTFTTTPKTRVFLMKNSSEYFNASLLQLVDGRKGKDQGWSFEKSTPFDIVVDEAKKQIAEIRQIYFP